MNSTSLFDSFRQLALLILTPKCFDKYFLDYDFLDKPCLAQSISKGLGIGIILGSVLVKLPQILKIYANKSGKGINLTSVTLDLSAITIYATYNFVNRFPFSAWGDAGFLAIQTVAIAYLILFYEKSLSGAIAYVLAYLIVLFTLAFWTPLNILWTLQGFNIPILVTGKLTQAYTNYCNGHTGQLSAVTFFMLFFGSIARIFTSIQDTGDTMVILTNVSSCLSNTVIVIQLLYYWNKEKTD